MSESQVKTNFRFTSLPKEVQEEQLHRFKGVCALYGYEGLLRLQNAHVVIIGNGGVGSWCAESLCRTGVGSITLLDFDNIEISNSNRQLHTLSSTIGKGKSETLGARLKDINPYLQLKTLPVLLQKDTLKAHIADALNITEAQLDAAYQSKLSDIPDPHKLAQQKFALNNGLPLSSDSSTLEIPSNVFVAEAIDDIFAKAGVVNILHRAQIPLVTSGGAGGRIDPSRVRLGDVSEARGDQLIKRLRSELRRNYGYPKGDRRNLYKFNILCSYSDEKPMRSIQRVEKDTPPENLGLTVDRPELPNFGASVTVTATAGLLLASVIIRWIIGANIQS